MEFKSTAPPEGTKLTDRDKPLSSSPNSSTQISIDAGAQGTSMSKGENTTPPTLHDTSSTTLTNVELKSTIISTGSYSLPYTSTNHHTPDFILLNDFITEDHASRLLQDTLASKTLKYHHNTVKGQLKKQPRSSAWFSHVPYSFSGCVMVPNNPGIIPSVHNICHNIMDISKDICHFTQKHDSYLVNMYRHGGESCGIHKDNEPIIDHDQPICCLSLGETRHLKIRATSNSSSPIICSIELKAGSLLIMMPGFREYYHNIPKDGSRKPRVSITYRKVRPLKPVLQLSRSKTSHPDSSSSTQEKSDVLAPSGRLWNSPTKCAPPETQPQERSTTPKQKPINTPIRPRTPSENLHHTLLKNNITFSPKCTTAAAPSTPACPTPSLTQSSISTPHSSTHYIYPLSMDTTLQCVASLKTKKALQNELTHHSLSTHGSVPNLKKRLHDHIKSLYANKHHDVLPASASCKPPTTSFIESNIPSITNSLSTLEASILKLSNEIISHQSLVETALIDNPQKTKKPISTPENNLSLLDRRIEGIEDCLTKMKETTSSTSATLQVNNTHIKELITTTKTTLNYLKTPSVSTQSFQPKPQTTQPTHSQQLPHSTPTAHPVAPLPTNQPTQQLPATTPYSTTSKKHRQRHQPPPQHQHLSQKTTKKARRKKAVIICDSQLKKFDSDKFSETFNTSVYRAYTYKDFLAVHQQQVIAIPGVECYVVQLGVNDLKDCNRPGSNTYLRVLSTAIYI